MAVPASQARLAASAVLVVILLFTSRAYAGGAIYGTVHLENGRDLTGTLRWDQNEIFWDDVLDAEKREQVWVEGAADGIEIFGLKIDGGDGHWAGQPFKIQFGHLAKLEPRSDLGVRIELKNGQRLNVRPSGTDLSPSMRSLMVTDRAKGDVEIAWDDIDRVEFFDGSAGEREDQRLFGLVETTAGAFRGFITWDRDEALTIDLLDGNEGDLRRKIPFGDIREIERTSSRSARVTRKDGSTLKLSGTNDVNDENRGIDVLVPDLGVIKVGWDQFERVAFESAPPSRGYADFDGGRRLYGTLTDQDGDTFTGYVTWDLDEQYTWEFLDGEYDDLELEIPFDEIQSIHRDSRRAAEVRLKNGDVYVLTSSNDVDSDNKGIVIERPEGDEVEFDWYEFHSLELK